MQLPVDTENLLNNELTLLFSPSVFQMNMQKRPPKYLFFECDCLLMLSFDTQIFSQINLWEKPHKHIFFDK